MKERIKTALAKFIPTRRRLIQVYTALLYNCNIRGFVKGSIYTGAGKYACVPGLNCYSCPGAIGACPLGALQNAFAEKDLKASFYVLGIFILFGLLLGRTICGFLCPMGLIQELFYKIKTPKLKKNSVTMTLSYFKYVILAVLVLAVPLTYAGIKFPVPAFCKYICPSGTLLGAIGLLSNGNNAGMFGMLGGLFTWKFVLLVIFITASVFIFRFFCRFFCPLGAIYGFFAKVALLGVTIEKDKCTDCGLCVTECKMDVRHVGDHECIQCGGCIPVCPAKAIRWKGSQFFLHADETGANVLATEGANVSDAASAEALNAEAVGADVAAHEINIRSMAVNVNRTATDDTGAGADNVKDVDGANGVGIDNAANDAGGASVANAASIANAANGYAADAEQNGAQEKGAKGSKSGDKGKKRLKIFEISFWSALLAVLIAVIITVNFVGIGASTKGVSTGEACPHFELTALYGDNAGENFDPVAEGQGKVTVLNYWATWCTPCVAELPYFDRFYKEHSDKVNVYAVHELRSKKPEDVRAFIEERFSDFTVTFAMDYRGSDDLVSYTLLGGSEASTWPMTVILSAEGRVIYARTGSMTYEKLTEVISPYI